MDAQEVIVAEGGSWSLRRRIVVVLAACCITIAGLVAVAPSPASAAPCTGSGCNGKDPDATGCNDPAVAGRTITRYSFTTSNGHYSYQLRHSTGCDAEWGRFIRDDCGIYPRYHIWLRVQTQVWSGSAWVAYTTRTKDMGGTQPCNGGTNWTRMVPATSSYRTRVCRASSPDPDHTPSDVTFTCSAYYAGL